MFLLLLNARKSEINHQMHCKGTYALSTHIPIVLNIYILYIYIYTYMYIHGGKFSDMESRVATHISNSVTVVTGNATVSTVLEGV